MSKIYASTKTYTHAEGLSCTFRQWRADSHCNQFHGYSISPSIEFRSKTLDERNWVFDFGGLKDIKLWLHKMYDHKTIITKDDPEFERLYGLCSAGIADIRVVERVGMEAFAEEIFDHVDRWLLSVTHGVGPKLYKVTVAEHEGNSASVINGDI